jgi:ATP-binding cassette subfamily B (MDR/TAP) protein 1
VATSISNNADLIQTGLSEKVGVAFQSLAMLTAAFIVAFIQGWKLTLVVATTLPAAVLGVGITVMLDARQEAKILAIYATAAGLVEESLSSIRNVAALGANAKFQKRYDAYLDKAKGFGVKKGPILGVQYSSEFFVMHCAYALAFWYGVRLLQDGQMRDGGQVVTVLFAVIIGTTSITMIAPAVGDFTKAGAAAKSVLELIAQEPKIDPVGTGGIRLGNDVKGSIAVKNVTFAYPARPTMNVLNDVSMEFEAQKTTAIVGASGSGKSTIVALLERWYDPASGSLEVDSHDITTLNVKSLRSQIGLVQQEPVLLNDTIYNNVVHGLFGTPMDALPEEDKRKLVKEACIEANADSFIQELPDGYDTKVGERGGFISGGQKQRVAIARSIIKNPRILLLDEATSALDPTAEGLVQAALDRVSQTRTTIMIAHKLSTVKKADKIIVLNQGKVIEEGTHEGLLKADGAYAKLVAAQNLGSTADDEDGEDDVDSSVQEEDAILNLEKSQTRMSTTSVRSQLKNEDVARRYSLFKCLCIILYERRNLWLLFLGGFISAVVGGGVFPAQAIIFSRAVLVFQYTGSKIISETNFWALMFFCLALATLLSYCGIGLFMTIAAFLTTRVYRSQYFAAMLGQDIEFYDIEGNEAGALTSRLSTDPARLQDTVSANLGLIMIVITTLLSCCILSLVLGWQLAIVAIVGCIPALFFAGFMRMRLEMESQDKNAKMYQESARFAAEAVGAIRTVSSLTLEEKVMQSYGERLDVSMKKAYRHIPVSMFLFGLSESLDLVGKFSAFVHLGY